jgi:hypothetical protein
MWLVVYCRNAPKQICKLFFSFRRDVECRVLGFTFVPQDLEHILLLSEQCSFYYRIVSFSKIQMSFHGVHSHETFRFFSEILKFVTCAGSRRKKHTIHNKLLNQKHQNVPSVVDDKTYGGKSDGRGARYHHSGLKFV